MNERNIARRRAIPAGAALGLTVACAVLLPQFFADGNVLLVTFAGVNLALVGVLLSLHASAAYRGLLAALEGRNRDEPQS